MSMRSTNAQRSELASVAHKIAAKGWVANHDGNVSLRIAPERFLATPTATAKADIDANRLIEVDGSGKKVAGELRPFSEIAMHMAVFAEREDVNAVVHAHPPYATAIACSGSAIIEKPFIAEAIVSLGPLIPTLPFSLPGPESVAILKDHVQRVDGVLLANHGVFTWGPNLELAYLRMELIEHLARIATLAQATGGVQPLPDTLLPKLLASRAKAKQLGRAAERAMEFVPKTVVACAPAPHAAVSVKAHQSNQLTQIIKEELSKLLSSE